LFFATAYLQFYSIKLQTRTARSKLSGMITSNTKNVPSWRRYRDVCGTAQGLDLVGERWALLVVRELLLGPKRFTDLRKGLPGVSSNILAERLDGLERSGVVRRRRLPALAASKVYELTDWGMELDPRSPRPGAVGGAALHGGAKRTRLSVDGLVLSFRAIFDPRAAEGFEASYDILLDEQGFGLDVADGRIEISRGASGNPDARIKTDTATLGALVYEGGYLDEALRSGDAEIEGDKQAVERLLTLFTMPKSAFCP
jgi:DNA-binding HxlR family transcriptional regulator